MGAALLVGVFVARVYGPDGLGSITTAIAVCTIVLGFSALGMSGILVKELIENPQKRGVVMTTVVVGKLILGLILYGLMLVIVWYFDSSELLVLTAIIGLGYLFTSLDVFEANFNADSDFKRLVGLHIAGVTVATGAKVLVLLLNGDIRWLAVGYALDYMLLYALPAMFFFRRIARRAVESISYTPGFRRSEMSKLLGRSWPIMISGFLAQVNLRIDSIMIAALVSVSQVGIYSAAGRLSESWTVLAMALVSASFPALVRSSKSDRDAYSIGLTRLLRLLIWISLGGALAVMATSQWIIQILYGDSFQASSTILSIHIFGGMFLFMRTALSRWLIVEDLYMFSLVSHGTGAAVNIIGNALVLDRFGIIGAAWVSVISYATSGLLFLLFTSRTRVLFFIILWAAVPGKYGSRGVRKLVDSLPSAVGQAPVSDDNLGTRL